MRQTRHSLFFFFNEPFSIRYCAPFLANDRSGSDREQNDANEAYGDSNRGPSNHMDILKGSLNSPNGETSEQMQSITSPTEGEMSPPQPTTVRATHGPGMLQLDNDNDNHHQNNRPIPCRRQRIKVGFLSAFFYSHSVGLLVEGVVTRLDRRRFETTAIFLQPHPTSFTESNGDSRGDDVYNAIRAGTEHVLDVSSNRCLAQRVQNYRAFLWRQYAVILSLFFFRFGVKRSPSELACRAHLYARKIRTTMRCALWLPPSVRVCSLQCQVQRFRDALNPRGNRIQKSSS